MENKHSFFDRLCALVTCVLILLAIAISRDGTVFNHKVGKDNTEAAEEVPAPVINGSAIINTTELATDVMGFAGPVPMEVVIVDGIISDINLLPNSETPGFIARVEDELISKYKGMNVNDAVSAKFDAVSGATFSSMAVIENMHRALVQATGADESTTAAAATEEESKAISWKVIAALLVSLCAAIVPLVTKNRTYRTIQLILNVLVLGIWTGTAINYTSVVGFLSHGINLWKSLATVVLLIIAFIYPLFGKKNHYCAWCCPLGSLQELAGKASKKKIHMSQKLVDGLEKFRLILWSVLMLLSWSGVFFSWMNYELFMAFLWQSASWIIITIAALTIVLSAFINRPYCRFVCPTGTLLKFLN